MIYVACAPIDELADQGRSMGARDDAYVSRITHQGRRAAALAARALLVRLLHEAGFVDTPQAGATGWNLVVCDDGQRELHHDGGKHLYVSLSHSEREAAAALSAETPVGVDVEDEGRMREPTRLLRHVATDAELEFITISRPEGRDTIATLLWSLKEAYSKLEGGLLQAGRKVEVLPDGGDVLSARVSDRAFLWSERRTAHSAGGASRLALAARKHQPLVALGCSPARFPTIAMDTPPGGA